MKNNGLKQILGILLVYLIIGTLFGSFKIELIQSHGNFLGISFLRMISHLTLYVTSTMAIVTLGIIIALGYFSLVLVKSDISLESYAESIVWLVWMYILDEISKTFLLYFSLPKNTGVINTSSELINLSNNSKYLSMSFLSDIIFISLGLILYSVILKRNEVNITWPQVIFSTILLSLNFVISHLI